VLLLGISGDFSSLFAGQIMSIIVSTLLIGELVYGGTAHDLYGAGVDSISTLSTDTNRLMDRPRGLGNLLVLLGLDRNTEQSATPVRLRTSPL
jgi:hypothetical protein